CALSSVKSNIGHTLSAAGVASVHKVLLEMQHQSLVPSLNFKTPNEHFDFDDSPFFVNTELRPWQSSGAFGLRRAAISSFGYSGTNAHLVLEEHVQPARQAPASSGPVAVLLSAKDEERLKEQAKRLLQAISVQGLTQADLPDMA